MTEIKKKKYQNFDLPNTIKLREFISQYLIKDIKDYTSLIMKFPLLNIHFNHLFFFPALNNKFSFKPVKSLFLE